MGNLILEDVVYLICYVRNLVIPSQGVKKEPLRSLYELYVPAKQAFDDNDNDNRNGHNNNNNNNDIDNDNDTILVALRH